MSNIVNRAVWAAAANGFHVLFQKGMAEAKSETASFRLDVPSSTAKETYAWAGADPALKPWLDDARFQGMRLFSFEVPNIDYQMGLEIDRNDAEDDRLGIIAPRIG